MHYILGSVTLPNIAHLPTVLRTGRQLADAGLIADDAAEVTDLIGKRYSVAIPNQLATLINPTDPKDPIAQQFIPNADELSALDDEHEDPIGDDVRSPLRGLVHRYPDRVLLMPTLSCPVYCRYCFRREKVGRDAAAPSAADMENAIDYIGNHSEIREVILTGGDPLSLSDNRLGALLRELDKIPHLSNLRIHTRVPVALPSRITSKLIDNLQVNLPIWTLLHVNHARELTNDVADACAQLNQGGIPLLSQSVLLRGVNDDAKTLSELFRRLVELKVKPYYLHHPDRARGTSRFRLTIREGLNLVYSLRGRISGLCQPTYVVDIPGGFGKVPITGIRKTHDGTNWLLTDFEGRQHIYQED